MRDYVYIGCSPIEEDCVQVSRDHEYETAMAAELGIYKRQLERMFPPPPGAYFRIKWESHDFGRYGEVVAVYDSNFPEEAEWAFNAEFNSPERWDAIAIGERRAAGLPEVDHV